MLIIDAVSMIDVTDRRSIQRGQLKPAKFRSVPESTLAARGNPREEFDALRQGSGTLS